MLGQLNMKSVGKIGFAILKIVGVLLSLSFFLYQLWEVADYYWDENIFQSTKTQTYTGRWVMPLVTICPDPAVQGENIGIENIRYFYLG